MLIKQLLTTVLVIMFLAPQTALEADDSDSGFKNKPGKVHNYKWPKYKWPRFDKTPSADKEAMEVLSQAIEGIKQKIEALEEQLGDIPEDLTETLTTLQIAVSNNTSDISLALSDIERIVADIEKILSRLDKNEGRLDELESAVADISARLAALESTVGDHELRLLALEQSGSPENVVFSGDFEKGKPASMAIRQAWSIFKSDATGSFKSIEMKSSLGNASAKCTDPDVANILAEALHTFDPSGGAVMEPLKCDGLQWNVGACFDGVELNAGITGNICGCGQDAMVIRPLIGDGNINWGGVGSSFNESGDGVCGPSNQTLEVILTR